MNNKDFMKNLGKRLNNEEITLPESLSAENIEWLINEKGGILEPKRPKEKKSGKVIKIITSVAAVIAIVVGVVAVADVTANKIEKSKQDDIIAEQAADSDYSKIETAVLNYYKELYNKRNSYDSDGFLNGFGAVLDSASVESAVDTNSSASNSNTGDANFTADATDAEDNMGYTAYGTTNVQVSGVDEADIIKNDGRYIYFMRNDKIVIADCQKPEDMNVVSEIELSDDDNYYSLSEMFLYDDKLVIVINQQRENDYAEDYGNAEVMFDCCYVLDNDTVIRVYDIGDKSAPELCYSQFISGNYVSSRIVDGKLIAVARYSIPYSGISCDNFEDACEEVKAYSVPEYSVNGGEMQKIPSDRIGLLDEDKPTEYVITALVDLKNESIEPLMNAYLGGGSDIYCTKTELFVAEAEYSVWTGAESDGYLKDDSGREHSSVTHIYKFDITDEGVLYNNDARVGGTWLNQFSMDKYGDYFRIATIDYSTMVYILDKDMKIVGFVGDIAPQEDMKSARFMGNMLYLVTFYQTDPLFIIDLSDPTAPEVKGELKIPGFSSYLHPIGENLVIGIGEGGTMSGTDGSGKVSLFDVSDPCNPKEIDNYTVANAYFDSNHKAFTTVDDDTFVLCLTKYGYDKKYNYCEDWSVVMFDVTDSGITVHGEYDVCERGNDKESYSSFRSTFISDTLFAVNGYGIKSYSMTTNELLGELRF